MVRKTKKSKKSIKKKQKGGLEPGSTSGNVSALANDIVGTIESIYQTIKYGVTTVVDVIELPGDMGRAYSSPAAPRPSDIKF